MSRFARIEEQAIKYQSELTGEEFRLYCLIKFHTWNDSGVCNKDLHELAEIYSLNYDHTTARYKVLRTKGWCENSKQKIKPIAHLKTGFYKALETSKNEVVKTSKSEVFKAEKLQKTKFETSKNEVDNAAKLQKVKFPLNPYIEPLKDENFSDTTSSDNNDGLSEFSEAECLAWVERRIKNGEQIETPHRLARWAYQTGKMDAYISATLYPEAPVVEQTVKCEEEFTVAPEPLGENVLRSRLSDLRLEGYSSADLEEHALFYTAEDLAWLKDELEKIER